MIIYHINRLIFALLHSMSQVGPDVTVLARIDAKPHPSAVDEVISLLLSDTIEQKLILSDESSCLTRIFPVINNCFRSTRPPAHRQDLYRSH